jgi:oxidase EvaA
MTLGQIRKLMRVDNIVNMDSRTVISCIPYSTLSQTSPNPHCPLFNSVFKESSYSDFRKLTRKLNDYKMFDDSTVRTVPLLSLSNWEFKDNAFACKAEYPFKVIFCDIEIEGREVRHWHQPLFEAIGKATFALVYCDDFGDNVRRFLCKVTPEIGAFDKIELGAQPYKLKRVQNAAKHDAVSLKDSLALLENKNNIEFDHFLSEEGGHFYHEQNRNLLSKS